MTKRIFIAAILAILIAIPATSHADIKLKVAAVNPSETETQTTPVRYDLPKGMTPAEITDIGSMELKYDFDKGSYYLYKIVKLKPLEKVVLEIGLRDIWTVSRKEINFLKGHTKALTEKLKNTKHAKVGNTLAKKILNRLDDISKKEAEQGLSMGEHINLYYENMGILGEVKEDIGMLENLVLDVGGVVEERVKVPATLAVPIKGGEKAQDNLVELNIKISNPSKTAKQPANLKYMLPEELAPRYIVDRGGLEMGYDFAKQSFYVYKEKMMLNPSETRNFVIKIIDIWQIPYIEMDALRTHTENLMLLLKGTEYMAQAQPLEDKIKQDLSEIRKTQILKVSADEHIAYYRNNKLLLDDAKKVVGQLEKMVSQSGASAGVTIKEAEVQRGGGPKVRRPRGYEGIDFIVKSIFRGKAPTVATTWKIIFAILIFIGVLAAIFFWLWYVQVQKGQKQDEELETLKEKSPGDKAQGSEKTEEKKDV